MFILQDFLEIKSDISNFASVKTVVGGSASDVGIFWTGYLKMTPYLKIRIGKRFYFSFSSQYRF